MDWRDMPLDWRRDEYTAEDRPLSARDARALASCRSFLPGLERHYDAIARLESRDKQAALDVVYGKRQAYNEKYRRQKALDKRHARNDERRRRKMRLRVIPLKVCAFPGVNTDFYLKGGREGARD